MNKRLGCMLVVTSAVVSYAAWVVLPLSHHEAECGQIIARVSQSRTKLQSQAEDRKLNGYLDPDFLPFWGARSANPGNLQDVLAGKDTQPDCEIRSLLERLSPICDLEQSRHSPLEMFVSQRATQALRPVLDFGYFYPKVQRAENRPVFLVPDPGPHSHLSSSFNFIALRKLAYGCAAYADYLALNSQGDKALEVCCDTLNFGNAVRQGASGLLDTLMAVQLQQIAQSSLAMVLQSEAAVTAKELSQVASTLESTQSRTSLLVEMVENDFVTGLNTCEEVAHQPRATAPAGLSFGWLPGLWAREIRLFKNDYFGLIEQARIQGTITMPKFEDSPTSWFLGRQGRLAEILIPDFTNIGTQLSLLRKRQAFLHLYCHLRLYRLAKGAWPSELSQLALRGYKPLDGLDLSRVNYSCKGKEIQVELDLESADAGCLPKQRDSELQKWQVLSAPPWILH